MAATSTSATSARLQKYETLEKLGEGTYGVVFKARNTQNNQIVAIKQIRLEDEDEGVPGTAIREVAILKELSRHPNIVKLLDVVIVNHKLWLVFEFVDYDLHKFLSRTKAQRRPLDPALIKNYMYQMVRSVAYCHSHRILHRDLKPGNLLLDQTGSLKLADFGLARAFGVPLRAYSHNVVTLWYRAPEILLGLDRYSVPVDVWSMGCIFAELVNLRPLFQGDSEIDQIYKVFEIMGTPNNSTWEGVESLPDYSADTFPGFKPQNLQSFVPSLCPSGLDLLEKMLVMNPSLRISAKEALAHPYFQEIHQASSSSLIA